jgi:coenzyme F420-reducing hydrogenase beta subunit
LVEYSMESDKTEKYRAFKTKEEAQIESQFLRGTKNEDIGTYCDMFSAKSAFEGQDGGAVTALLSSGFEVGLFDAAVVVQRIEGYNAEAVVAQNVKEVAAAKGTKYLKVNVVAKLRELVNQGKKHIAIVCTPCQVKVVRKIQQTLKGDTEITVIGLFCFEAFNRRKLKDEIKSRLGVDLDKAEKTQVREGRFNLRVDGKDYSCKVKDLDSAAEKVCDFCDDFTSQFADISVGSVGSKAGYSTVIVRSEAGKNLGEKLKAVKEPVDKAEITRLAKFKRERARKAFLNQGNTSRT